MFYLDKFSIVCAIYLVVTKPDRLHTKRDNITSDGPEESENTILTNTSISMYLGVDSFANQSRYLSELEGPHVE